MGMDRSAQLKEYPDVISKEQLCKICHISKRKATWLLEHGYIPCKDSGKKTRRFKVRKADVLKYLRTLETVPYKVETPKGAFCSIYHNSQEESPARTMRRTELRKHLAGKLAAEPDALEIKDVARIMGCSSQTVRQWIDQGELQFAVCPHRIVVAKQWLVSFLVSYLDKHPYDNILL